MTYSFLVIVVLITAFATAFATASRSLPDHFDDVPSNRILGGRTAKPGQFPYQVSLRDAATNRHYCGGSIISSFWVLTAAHCIQYTEPEESVVVVGGHFVNVDGTVYNVSQMVTHNFDVLYGTNDIALLRTQLEIEFNDLVQPIPIGDGTGRPISGAVRARASGWGSEYVSKFLNKSPKTKIPMKEELRQNYAQLYGPPAEELKYLDVTTLSNYACRARLSAAAAKRIRNSTLCVYGVPTRGMCRGDSGGPLVANGTLIGATSWGKPCGLGMPDVFTRISYFVPWILDIINEN